MANIVINSRFNPFTYQEMLQPVLAATDEHRLIEDAYSELGIQADVWQGLANEQTDPNSYRTINNYSNDLLLLALSLALSGLNGTNRLSLNNLRRRYASEITPIQTAYTRRQALLDELRKILALDNTAMFSLDPSTTSLDTFVSNPSLSYQTYSGATLAKLVGTAALNLAKSVREDPRKWRTVLGGLYYETLMLRGFRPEEVLSAIQNNPNASPELSRIVNDALQSSGILTWGNQGITQRALEYANQGLWSAVGTTEYAMQSNKAYDYAMLERLATIKANASRQAKQTFRAPISRGLPGVTVNGVNTTTVRDNLQFLLLAVSDPEFLNRTETRIVPRVGGGAISMYASTPAERLVPVNREKFNSLIKLYGINPNSPNVMTDLQTALTTDLRRAAIQEVTPVLNTTDATNILSEVKTRAEIGNSTGIRVVDKNGKVDNKEINEDDLSKLKFDNSGAFYLDPVTGSAMALVHDEKNKAVRILIDPRIVDIGVIPGTTERLNISILNDYREALNQGDMLTAKLLGDMFMEGVYYAANTKRQGQGNTVTSVP